MGIIERYYKDKLYYEIKGFKFDNNMSHLFSTRIGWDQNRLYDNLAEILSICDKKVYKAKQVHGTNVKVIKKEDNKSISLGENDGFITDQVGVALCTYHADCLPIYFYDNVKKVIGLAHGGWKGTLGNISNDIIDKMTNNFNSNIKDVKVAIGPSIGKCCYEIGKDVKILFTKKYPNNLEIIKEIDNKIFLDLWKANIINLLDLGIHEENIFLSNTCTACSLDKFYSYRKENGTKNRMIGSIIINS